MVSKFHLLQPNYQLPVDRTKFDLKNVKEFHSFEIKKFLKLRGGHFSEKILKIVDFLKAHLGA